MPIWLRKFTYNLIAKHYEKNSTEKSQDAIIEKNIETIKSANSVNRPLSVSRNTSVPKVTPHVYNVKSNKK